MASCRTPEPEESTTFSILKPEQTGIFFENTLQHDEQINTYTFKNFYNGAGVGLADFDNDGLIDIFLCGNQVSNALFRNNGDLRFTDITKSSNLNSSGVWTTGVSIVDINADGFLDIYLCHSGPPGGLRRSNELFINNGDLTFTEKAKTFGLDFTGLSTHAAFFDFDRDGDLDAYLLNNSMRSVGGYDLRKDQRLIPDPGGNKLLKNDGGHFVDVSQQAGIYTSAIGFGLGVAVGDTNLDGWPDLYVSNDFFERDYLYINNKNGSFSEKLETCMTEISMGSMGADLADLNNDGRPEIFVTEMLPASDTRLKTKAQFENWNKYTMNLANGYYRQFGRNVLQYNNGDGTFSEVGRLSNVAATDWSWGALIFDMDNDGHKDIFVANGIYKDLLDQDYLTYVAGAGQISQTLVREGRVISALIDSIPSTKLPNFVFRNLGNLQFVNVASEWGMGEPSFSNGAAYGDLDNDGDLDLVINNVNMPAFVCRNNSGALYTQHAFLNIRLEGDRENTQSIGAKVYVVSGGNKYYQELFPMRGFMSSVDYRLHFGLGTSSIVDSITVEWPDQQVTILRNIPVNQHLRIKKRSEASSTLVKYLSADSAKSVFNKAEVTGVDFVHQENDYVDFDRDKLQFHMSSNEGPCICTADVDSDGRDDFYIGGARGQSGALYLQIADGKFKSVGEEIFVIDKESEDTSCAFFDADGDGDVDLYVGSGSNEVSPYSSTLLDRLYFNKGEGDFKKSKQPFPSMKRFESTGVVSPADFDADGDIDLFVGVRLLPLQYGVPADSYLLENDGKGNFKDITTTAAEQLRRIGMVTDATWADMNGDGSQDLIVAGEWMPVRIFENIGGKLRPISNKLLEKTNGWYHALEVADFNEDGRPDLALGNHGLNSRFKSSEKNPLKLYVNDFDRNGSIEQILTYPLDGKDVPLVLRNDLVSQLPHLKKNFLYFKNYAGKGMTDIFDADNLSKAIVHSVYNMESIILLNLSDTSFQRIALPLEAQFTPLYALTAMDVNDDKCLDLVAGGNLYRAKPEMGIYAAGYGLVLIGKCDGTFHALPSTRAGLRLLGEIREIVTLSGKKRSWLLAAMNNDSLKFYSKQK